MKESNLKNLINEVIAETLKESNYFTLEDFKPDKSGEYKISSKERNLLNAALTKFPQLTGNKKYDREGGKSSAIGLIGSILDKCGFTLDMVSGDLILGQKGNRLLSFRKKVESNDPFVEGLEVVNSRISFTWENLSNDQYKPNYQILAYVS